MKERTAVKCKGESSLDKVSIIAAIYNVAPYVNQCIESIVNQTWKNIEILLVNDGSTDESLSVCRKWEAEDPRIRVLDQPNQGVSAARNRGIAAGSGKWICFVDGDDWIEADAVERMVSAVTDDTDVLITDYFVNTGNVCRKDSFFSLPDHDFAPEEHIELIKNCYLKTSFSNRGANTMVGVPWAKLFRSDFLRETGILFDPKLRKMQDAVFCSEVFQNSTHVIYRAVPTYHYRQNPDSVTHRGNAAYQQTADAVLEAFRSFIQKYQHDSVLLPVYYARRFIFACESVKFIYILDESGLRVREKIRGVRQIMTSLDLGSCEKELLSYLGKSYRLAYFLRKMKLYGLMYALMSAFYQFRTRRMGRS